MYSKRAFMYSVKNICWEQRGKHLPLKPCMLTRSANGVVQKDLIHVHYFHDQKNHHHLLNHALQLIYKTSGCYFYFTEQEHFSDLVFYVEMKYISIMLTQE